MHEMSIALEIAGIAERRLGANVGQLVEVGVEVGDHAGVEPSSLAFCLEAVLATPPFRGAHGTILPVAGDDLRVSYFEVDDGDPDD